MADKTQRMAAAEYRRLGGKGHKPRKYRNTPVEYNGLRFDSKRERDVYIGLRTLELAGHIKNLKCQMPFRLHAKVKYIADFAYYDVAEGKNIAVDVKGFETAVFRLKKRLFEADIKGWELRIIK